MQSFKKLAPLKLQPDSKQVSGLGVGPYYRHFQFNCLVHDLKCKDLIFPKLEADNWVLSLLLSLSINLLHDQRYKHGIFSIQERFTARLVMSSVFKFAEPFTALALLCILLLNPSLGLMLIGWLFWA